MKTLFKAFLKCGCGFTSEVVLYRDDRGNCRDLHLFIGGKRIWSSSPLPSHAVDGTGWAEAAFDEPRAAVYWRMIYGSGGGAGGGVSPDETVIHGTSGGAGGRGSGAKPAGIEINSTVYQAD